MMNAIPKFMEAHATLLDRFLTSPQRPKGAMTYPQLAGFLFSMANAPELIPPSEWMPIVFNDQDPRYETRGEAERVLQAMMALYNDCGREKAEGSAVLPQGLVIRPRPLDNLEADAPLSHWARGFAMGYSYFEEVWSELAPAELDEELGAILMVLTFFSSPRLADAYFKEANRPTSLEHLAETVVMIFPDAANGYARLGRAIFQATLKLDAEEPEPSGHPKVGRNDPCPCGSGKKFKKCCGAT